MRRSKSSHFEILGVPIGDLMELQLVCIIVYTRKRVVALHLLKQLKQVGFIDPQVALLLLRLCGGFCRLVHLDR